MQTQPRRPKRSVRHAAAEAQRPPRPTPSHLAGKQARERRLQVVAIAAAVVVVLLVAFIPAYGYWRDVLHLGAEPLVVVDGQTITTADYARYLGTRQEILQRQIVQAQAAMPTPIPAATGTPGATPTPGLTPAQQTFETLTSQESALSTTALTDLIEAHLILDEARARHLTVSQAELHEALRWLLSPPPAGLTARYGLQAAPATYHGLSLISSQQATAALDQLVGKGHFLPADQITELIVKPAVLKTKLIAALGKNVPATEDEVHARHILVPTEAEASSIRQQLLQGADFAALAKRYSTDPGTKDKGGDLGWFGHGVMVAAFDKAAFSLKVGDISQPVKTSFGYHIIQVLARDPHHPLTPDQLQQARERAYQNWLSQQDSDQQRVHDELSTTKLDWARNYAQQGN